MFSDWNFSQSNVFFYVIDYNINNIFSGILQIKFEECVSILWLICKDKIIIFKRLQIQLKRKINSEGIITTNRETIKPMRKK